MNFDSVRTYLHGIVVMCVSMIGTTIVMFRGENEWLYAEVVLCSFVLFFVTWRHGSHEQFHHDILIGGYIWWLWLVYGALWSRDVPSWSVAKSVLLTVIGLGACTVPSKKNALLFMFTLTFVIPTDLVPLMEPWDGFLHVCVYLFTYCFQYYTRLYLEEDLDLYLHVLQSTWILFVSKWFVPFVGIQWMSYAYRLSSKLSAHEVDVVMHDDPHRLTNDARRTVHETLPPTQRTKTPPPRSSAPRTGRIRAPHGGRMAQRLIDLSRSVSAV